MRIAFILAFMFPLLLLAQTKPNEFTEEANPNNSNFELYSQKSGNSRRATLYNVRKYMAPGIDPITLVSTPTATGNVSNLMEFVKDSLGDIYYIDKDGDAFQLYDESQGDVSVSASGDSLFVTSNGSTDTTLLTGLTGVTVDTFYFDADTLRLQLLGDDEKAVSLESLQTTIVALNGLDISGDTIRLAANDTLSADVVLIADGSNTFSLYALDGLANQHRLYVDNNQIDIGNSDVNFSFSDTALLVTLNNYFKVTDVRATPNGIQYSADYSAGFTDRSLPDLGAVRSEISDSLLTVSSVTFSDGSNYEDVSGDTLNFVGDGSVTVTYNPTNNTFTINGTGGGSGTGEANVGENLGGQFQVFKQKSDTTFQFRTLDPDGILSITQNDTTLVLTATEADGSTTNEAWTIEDQGGVNSELINNQTVRIFGEEGITTEYNLGTNRLKINGYVAHDGIDRSNDTLNLGGAFVSDIALTGSTDADFDLETNGYVNFVGDLQANLESDSGSVIIRSHSEEATKTSRVQLTDNYITFSADTMQIIGGLTLSPDSVVGVNGTLLTKFPVSTIDAQTLSYNNNDSLTVSGGNTIGLFTDGNNNTILGLNAGSPNNFDNSALGHNALQNIDTGSSNTAIGKSALESNVSGGQNTGIGNAALYSTTSSNNTALGYLSGYSYTGQYSTFLGVESGYYSVTGDSLIIIGRAGPLTSGAWSPKGKESRRLYIHNEFGVPTIYGELDEKQVAIADTIAGATLDVNGDLKVRTVTQYDAGDSVLVWDAGIVKWRDASTITDGNGVFSVSNNGDTIEITAATITSALVLSGDVNSGTSVLVNNTGSSSTGMKGQGSTTGVIGQGGTLGLWGISTGIAGTPIIASQNTTTNGLKTGFSLQRYSTSTPAVDDGLSITFNQKATAGTFQTGIIKNILSDVGSGTETSYTVIGNLYNGTVADRLYVYGDGSMNFDAYAAGALNSADSSLYILAVDETGDVHSTLASTLGTQSYFIQDSITGAVDTIDWQSAPGIAELDMTSASATVALTLQNPATAFYYTFAVKDFTGTQAITWPSNVKDINGVALGTITYSAPFFKTCYYDGTDYYCDSEGDPEVKLTKDSVTTTTLAIDLEYRDWHTTQVDMTSVSSSVTLTVNNPGVSGSTYVFHFRDISGTDNVVWPSNFYLLDGTTTLGTDALTTATIYTCYYDADDDVYHCTIAN